MSKFMLSMGLVLASLAGSSRAGQGVEPSQPTQGEAAQPAKTLGYDIDIPYDDYGPWQSIDFAYRVRDELRSEGFAANVITKTDGYWVRVFHD